MVGLLVLILNGRTAADILRGLRVAHVQRKCHKACYTDILLHDWQDASSFLLFREIGQHFLRHMCLVPLHQGNSVFLSNTHCNFNFVMKLAKFKQKWNLFVMRERTAERWIDSAEIGTLGSYLWSTLCMVGDAEFNEVLNVDEQDRRLTNSVFHFHPKNLNETTS